MNALHDRALRVAIPNKGRLNAPSIELLHSAGYMFRAKERKLYATSANGDAQFVFLRAEDIPQIVEAGAVHLGFTGSDLIAERGARVVELLSVDFGKCAIALAAKEEYTGGIEGLRGKRVATSFPSIAQRYFAQHNVTVTCIEMSGSLEIMAALGLADAIVDLVETGDTLRENNLKVIAEIGRYETKLIAHPARADDPSVQRAKRRIEGALIARQYSLLEYNVRREKFKDAEAITPGFNSPTVSDLDDKNFVAVQAMVAKKDVVDVMDKLEAIGATAIIETEIRNCRL